jgi:hypothetical protein
LLISEEYRQLNRNLHDSSEVYGISGQKYVEHVSNLLHTLGFPEKVPTVLDYGCGKSTLRQSLGHVANGAITADGNWQDYDPCIPGKDMPPKPADLVVCTDVMEHIEPECLDAVLDDLRRLTKVLLFIIVATRSANKTLSDGRNAHLIIEPAKWWLAKFMERFELVLFQRTDMGEFFVLLE